MAAVRKFISTSSLILVAIGISAAAIGVLFTFPENPLIWQATTWTLIAALVGLVALVIVSGYVLATNRAARTWQRITSFLIGFVCLVAVAAGSL